MMALMCAWEVSNDGSDGDDTVVTWIRRVDPEMVLFHI
mgnify:CR=1 FL=1